MKFKVVMPYDDFVIQASNSGDGEAVKQYYLDEKDRQVKVLLDADGKEVYHNLYKDIQMNKATNDYRKILSAQEHLDNIDTNWPEVDASELGSFSEVVNASNRIKQATGKSVKELLGEYREHQMSLSDLEKTEKKDIEPKKVVESDK